MALQNFQYDTIMREYSRRQSEVQRALEERRREAYSKVPRLLEIDQEVASLSARKARTACFDRRTASGSRRTCQRADLSS